MKVEAASWLKRQFQRLGFDVVRHPSKSVRTLTGHTNLLLRELSIDCVLDVGANVGQYGESLRALGYSGQVVSFEPVEATFRKLAERTAKDAHWQAVHLALGAENRMAAMNVTASSVLASLRKPSSRGPEWLQPQIHVVEQQKVRMARLDSIFDDLVSAPAKAKVFLKLDTQGWDLEVVEGATGCLERIVAIQTEVSVIPIYEAMPDWLAAMGCLRDRGFQPTWMAPVTSDGPIRVIEFDCVMVRGTSFGNRL